MAPTANNMAGIIKDASQKLSTLIVRPLHLISDIFKTGFFTTSTVITKHTVIINSNTKYFICTRSVSIMLKNNTPEHYITSFLYHKDVKKHKKIIFRH